MANGRTKRGKQGGGGEGLAPGTAVADILSQRRMGKAAGFLTEHKAGFSL